MNFGSIYVDFFEPINIGETVNEMTETVTESTPAESGPIDEPASEPADEPADDPDEDVGGVVTDRLEDAVLQTEEEVIPEHTHGQEQELEH